MKQPFIAHLKLLVVVSLSLIAHVAPAAQPETKPSAIPTVHFVDGYHGGVRGHMPLGVWRDVFRALDEFPQWKVSLDLEADSINQLRRSDPASYRRLQDMLRAPAEKRRVELVGGTYSQPYAWLFGGESLVRQFEVGLAMSREHFPQTPIRTYAVQESCFSSALPQILNSFGFRRAVLKNNTGFSGYVENLVDADFVDWVGPDGSCIAAVPRYACEAFRAIWSTDSATAPPEYARRCAERGIRHPAGMELQDFGWVAHPRVGWEHIEFVTWQDYFRRFDQAPRPQLPVTQERFLGFLPFGAEYLQKVGRAERELENRLPATEKLCALASVFAGRAYPADELKRAWIHLFDAQHHDAWAVANGSPPDALGPIGYKTAKREPSHLRDVSPNLRLTWSDQGAEGCRAGLAVCDHLTQAAAESLASVAAGTGADDKSVWVRVFNTAGAARREVAQAAVVAPPGTLAVRVSNAEGRTVPSQFLPTRKFHDADTLRRMSARGAVHPAEDAPPEDRLAPGESFTSGLVLFPAEVPTLGFATYRIEFLSTVESAAPTNGARTVRDAEGRLVIETDLYRIVLDPRKGGAVTGLLAKDLGQELCDAASAYAFHELRGYFINENAWLTSAASPARLEVIEIGPLRVRVVIRGAIGKHPFESMLTVVQGQRPIEFTTRLSFAPDVKIGDPWADGEGGADDRMRRSAHNARPKLSVLFPTVLRDARLYKDAAFDVCESRHADAFFTRWTEGKHNIVVNWLDVFDAARKTGLALATDHTTTYVQGDGVPPGLTLGWNWKDNQQPHKHGVFTDRPKIVRYAVWPHPGRWDEARLWQQNTLRAEPPLTQVMAAAPEPEASRRSLVQVEQDAFEIVTVRVAGRDLFIRLFNAESNAPPKTVTLMFKPQRADLVELDGRVIAELPLREAAGRYEVQVAMPRFGFRTLRLCGILRE